MEIIVTKDISNTIYLPEIGEHYHSVNGAIGESGHVFISAGFNSCCKQEIKIFEVGFGTGLNALLSYIDATKKGKSILYYAIELYPLENDVIKQLNYPLMLKSAEDLSEVFFKLHDAQWNVQVKINSNFTLHKIHGDIKNGIHINGFDVVYFDAFAPEKQPEMWTQEIFDEIFKRLNEGGTLVTYCAKGEIKRRLKRSGFKVEPLHGFAGKREMTRAWKM